MPQSLAPILGSAPDAEGGDFEQDGESLQHKFRSMVRRARAAIPQALPQGESLTTPLAMSPAAPAGRPDVELGEAEPHWAGWARDALDRVRQQAEDTAGQARQNLSQGLEKAKSTDWGEQVKGVQSSVAPILDRVSSSASSASSSFHEGSRSFQESVSRGLERAKTFELTEQVDGVRRGVTHGLEKVSNTASSTSAALSESSAQAAQRAREGAASAASSARGALTVAGERASGAATLAMDPAKLAKFCGVFSLGLVLVVISLNFVPLMVLKPQLFATFFTLGSMTMMSSFILLAGVQAFATALMQQKKLPFSVAYIVGLIGTLWATVIKRSYIFTSIMVVLQAVALLYFVCSYLPGGTATLNMLGRLGGRSVRSLVLN